MEKILVVGDIHGNFGAFKKALDLCEEKEYYLVSLGDIIDYGDENYEVVEAINEIIAAEKGLMVIGNHENKLKRWLTRVHEGTEHVMSVGNGLKATIAEWNKMNLIKKRSFESMFFTVLNKSKHWVTMGNLMFVHASAHPDMWYRDEGEKKLTERAMYGQIAGIPFPPTQYPTRYYNWVQDIPENHMVFFGHDILNTEKPTYLNKNVSTFAVSVDTGSSKGGRLTGIVLEKQEGSWNIVDTICFGA